MEHLRHHIEEDPAVAGFDHCLLVGTSEGESFRNSLARGADPRLDVKEESRRTANATERTADAVEELASSGAGVALASIMV